ncbi:MAG: DNA primase [Thermoprotei archaeon]|nr:MAG: DNA primase [Thermoprotei archaeon]RLE98376.1 MAG: DNA primase [Thermoprotei archaeon]
MGGLPVNAKYVIHARIEIDGIVDKPDIIGAIFGQTEGLLGSDLDLRELQNSGRIGRIEVSVGRSGSKVRGHIRVPSNLGKVETALIAAALEMVDRVGPYPARVEVTRIEDVRAEKRRRIVERAKELLRKLEEEMPEARELVEEVMEALKVSELIHYGPDKLPAGPEVDTADTVIIVEGRADVINLLKHGYRNVIALEGATIPRTIVELAKRKKTVLFIDGDRGGELIARNVLNVVKIDYVARAPPGREVEELTGKEIAKALKNKVSAREFLEALEREKRAVREEEKPPEKVKPPVIKLPEHVIEEAKELRGTLEAILYDEEWKPLKRVAVRDLVKTLSEAEAVAYVLFDGVVTQRIVDVAQTRGLKALIGARLGDVVRLPEGLVIATIDDLT